MVHVTNLSRLQRKFIVSKDLATKALAFTTGTAEGGPLVKKFRLVSVHIHFSAAVSPTITVTRVSKDGANYNTPFDITTLVANDNYIFEKAEGEGICTLGDQIAIVVTPCLATCYVTLILEDI